MPFKHHVFKPTKEMIDAFQGYSEFSDMVDDFFKSKDFSLPKNISRLFRICRSCEKTLPIEEFPSAGVGEKKYICKICNAKIAKAIRIKKAHEEGKTFGIRATVRYKSATEKECTACKMVKNRKEFTKQPKYRGGEISKCKECVLRKLREKNAIKKMKKKDPWISTLQNFHGKNKG